MASDSELKGVLPELIVNKNRLRDAAKARGILFTIAADGGLRTAARNAQLVKYRDDEVAKARETARVAALKAGASVSDSVAAGEKAAQKAYYRVSPTSFHLVGAAFDVAIVRRPTGMSWEQGYKTLGELAQANGLRWGGYFSAPADVFHFELRDAREKYAAAFAKMNTQAVATKPPGTGPVVLIVLALLGAAFLYRA